MSDGTLKPCPFCQGPGTVKGGVAEGWWAECQKCDCQIDHGTDRDGDGWGFNDTETEAIAAWNTRPTPDPAPELVERDLARKLFEILWEQECYNGVTLRDVDSYRAGRPLSMGGQVERHEAQALRLARAAIAAMGGEGYERGQRETVARIVAWIRTGAMFAYTDQEMADAIEAGEWK